MKKFMIGLATSSVLWGLVATFAFYYALHNGIIVNETISRYCAGHPVEYATTAMFWIGLADLLIKLAGSRAERRALKRGALFPPKRGEKEPVSKVDDYLSTIAKARDVRGNSIYLTRLGDALSFMKFGGSPDDLDQELRMLADDAYDERDGEYGMVKTFIWAIPILGFLGTVLGITVALGSLDLTHLETTGDKLAAGLKVAFDTTALALSLVFVLYFLQFFSRKQDAKLAANVSKLVDAELRGRFRAESNADASLNDDPTVRSLNAIVEAFDKASRAQTEIWTNATSEVAQKNLELAATVGEQFSETLDKRFGKSSQAFARVLDESGRAFVESTLQPLLEEAARKIGRIDALEERVARQTDALNETLKACADVVSLDERLTVALEKIAEVGEFEKTLNNLSATVCLLNSKLTSVSSATSIDSKDASRRAVRHSKALDALERSTNEDKKRAAGEPLVFHDFESGREIEKEPSSIDDVVVPPMPRLEDEPETDLESADASDPQLRSVLSKKRSV